jgi:hypothetical protein
MLRKKIKDNKHIINSNGEKVKLEKTYFYDYFYESDCYYVVYYKIMYNTGSCYMLIDKNTGCIIKENMVDLKKIKKLIKLLENV